MPEPRLISLRSNKDDEVTVRISLEKWGKEIEQAHLRGAVKGQQHLIYYLDMITKGYLMPDCLEQGQLDQQSWMKLKDLLKRLVKEYAWPDQT